MKLELRPITRSDTHHLVPSRYRNAPAMALRGLWDTAEEAEELLGLAGVTDLSQIATHGLLPGIGIHELVFGIPNADVINAAFTYASPSGSRFNRSDRGAWYAGLRLETSVAEVGYHKQQELLETSWPGPEQCDYDDYLADFSGEYAVLSRAEPSHADLLQSGPVPACYQASQSFAASLLRQGLGGVEYPSVPDADGACIACFRPALVHHVRNAFHVRITVEITGIASWAKIDL